MARGLCLALSSFSKQHTHTHTPYAIPGKYFQAEDKSLKTLAFVYFITSE